MLFLAVSLHRIRHGIHTVGVHESRPARHICHCCYVTCDLRAETKETLEYGAW